MFKNLQHACPEGMIYAAAVCKTLAVNRLDTPVLVKKLRLGVQDHDAVTEWTRPEQINKIKS